MEDHPTRHHPNCWLQRTCSWNCCCRDDFAVQLLDIALVDNHCRDRVSHNDKTHQLDSAEYVASANCHRCLARCCFVHAIDKFIN